MIVSVIEPVDRKGRFIGGVDGQTVVRVVSRFLMMPGCCLRSDTILQRPHSGPGDQLQVLITLIGPDLEFCLGARIFRTITFARRPADRACLAVRCHDASRRSDLRDRL